MNRRDTIIIAVLINAGLLIVLFVAALKSGPTPAPQEQEELTALPPQPLASLSEIGLPPLAAHAVQEEVDQVLRDHPNPAGAVSLPSAVDFTQDLKALAPPVEAQEAPPAPAADHAPAAGCMEVKVKKGDFLAKIARAHHTTVADIMRENGLASTNLKIGQTLRIPKGNGKTERSSETRFYIVKNGDNPWTIATKHRMKVDELLRLNHLDADTARRLKPGDKLRIQ